MEGKNRVQQKKAKSPFWIVVTSQERLNEIVGALDSKKIELTRLQDRFRITIDLKQSDIPEIIGKRILKKNANGYQKLSEHFEANHARLKMGVLAYNLLHMIRQFCVWHEELRRTIGWLIKRLIKVGARVSYHARRWYIHVASAFPLAHHYHAVLAYGQYLGNSCKSLQNILSRCPRDIP